ncbi:MAG TPA: DUF507 family protein [Candidatus Binatia bacterium]|nr:DUF507 family protein [Candidatus Binatia bacterium]
MSRLSDNRISALARLVLRELAAEGQVVNERAALAESKRVLAEHFQRDDKIDELVRRKIASLSRRVVPGSTEWDVLYRRYFEEEARKRKF